MSSRIDHQRVANSCCIDNKVSPYYHRYKLLRALAGTVAVTSFFLYNMSEQPRENAIWDEKETECMMEYLRDHASEAGDGGNFKETAYQAAATYIAPYRKSGPIKTAKHVKNKYKTVSILITGSVSD